MISLVLLAGGTGTRMGASTPKQYLFLQNKPVALHSLEMLQKNSYILETIVVCEPEYQHFFSSYCVRFALPGKRRQDSVYSGLKECTQAYVLIHDSVRPFVDSRHIPPLIDALQTVGAGALAIPMTSTIKQCTTDYMIEKTVDRTFLWEMQTPQGARREILLKAYEYAANHHLEVTDDMAALELIGQPAKIIPSSPSNFKITTPFDLAVAKTVCAIN